MSRISRRQFAFGLGASLPAITLGLAAADSAAQATEVYSTLPLPPVIDLSQTAGVAEFSARKGSYTFGNGMASETYGYSADFLGPVIKVKSGSTLQVKFKNELDVATSVHWHGVFVPSDLDGGPHNPVAPGATWEPALPITQRASTAWFHPHPHGDTARQVHMGLAGLIYIEDETSAALGLPDSYGVDDFPLVLQDRTFDDMGMMVYDNSPMAVMHGSRGAQVIVNGAILPQANVTKGLVRLRLLNGANARNFWLTFDDGRAFHVIANDNGFLAKSAAVKDLVIAPGERYEILVDFSDGKAATLQTFGDAVGNKGAVAPASNMTDATAIMSIVAKLANSAKRVPEQLVELEATDQAKSVKTREFILDSMMMANKPMMDAAGQGNMAGMDHSKMDHSKMPGMKMAGMDMSGLGMGMKMSINGKTFDMDRIDAEPALGSSEVWNVRGTEMAHPFHIHGASFRVLQLDGAPPPEHQSGWKDTVLVRETAQLLVKFDQPATAEKPFMYHCHILEHEDAGMMAQYKTV